MASAPKDSTMASECTCPECTYQSYKYSSSKMFLCTMCQECFEYNTKMKKHYQTHFKHDGKFLCAVDGCNPVFAKWADLRRHSKKHCTRRELFDCPILGCHRKGQDGFPRKDKMMDHKLKAHRDDFLRRPHTNAQPRLAPKPATDY